MIVNMKSCVHALRSVELVLKGNLVVWITINAGYTPIDEAFSNGNAKLHKLGRKSI